MRWFPRRNHSVGRRALRPQPLTDAQIRAWRRFVSECNEALAAGREIPELKVYAERIRDAVIRRRISVEDFVQKHPAPWRRKTSVDRG